MMTSSDSYPYPIVLVKNLFLVSWYLLLEEGFWLIFFNMGNFIRQFVNSTRETKWFIANWFVYIFIIVITAVYCYVRLDYVRSYKTQTEESSTWVQNLNTIPTKSLPIGRKN
jgi:hypothetical protein